MRIHYLPCIIILCIAPTAFSETPVCIRTVVGRHLFYNHSFYDGNDGAGVPSGTPAQCAAFLAVAACDDNTAVPEKRVALLPGQTPHVPALIGAHGGDQIANYSSYTKGINGIMIDVQFDSACTPLLPGEMNAGQIASTFEFKEGGRVVSDPYTGNLRVPQSVTIATHPTLASTNRITIIFADNISMNSRWLRTRILPGGAIDGLIPLANGDLDRFYFGLAICSNLSASAGVAYVNTSAQNDPKADPHTTFTRAGLEDRSDYNKDSLVNTTDQILPQSYLTTTFTGLRLTGTAP